MKYITKTWKKPARMKKEKQNPPISYKDNVQKAYEKTQLRS